MALRLYHDADATQEITLANPDEVRVAVEAGQDLEDIEQLYLASDDTSLTYENISITKVSDGLTPAVVIEYALDDAGSPGVWQTTLNVPDGAYIDSEIIWRRAFKADVQEAFTREDIAHEVTADEYVA